MSSANVDISHGIDAPWFQIRRHLDRPLTILEDLLGHP